MLRQSPGALLGRLGTVGVLGRLGVLLGRLGTVGVLGRLAANAGSAPPASPTPTVAAAITTMRLDSAVCFL